MMRILWKFNKVWNEHRDYVIDARTWSYRCRDSSDAWECFFRKTLPCPDPNEHHDSGGYTKLSKKHLLLSDWNLTSKGASTIDLPEYGTPEIAEFSAHINELKGDDVTRLRAVAKVLLQLNDATATRVRERVAQSGVNLTVPFISVHFRRGDKFRESMASTPPVSALVRRIDAENTSFDWVFALTDDAAAVDELRAAAPHWTVKSFVDPRSVGFNECMLPSVRQIRLGACLKMCTNLTAAAFGPIRRRSYCFMNPEEPDNAKLIPVPMNTTDAIQPEAGFSMLVDIWAATRSVRHFSVGCGSNVDKIIQILRDAPSESTACYERASKQCSKVECPLRKCSINPLAKIQGLDCDR
jgi:hypothetical protein